MGYDADIVFAKKHHSYWTEGVLINFWDDILELDPDYFDRFNEQALDKINNQDSLTLSDMGKAAFKCGKRLKITLEDME